jgi:TonB family protein
MNRLQKKCLVASAGVHLLMALILFIGPGFISSRSKQDDMPILNFVPVKTVDELMSGGGNPNAKPPAPAPVQPPSQPQTQPPPQVTVPMPKPQPEKVREPDPPKEIQPTKREEDSLEPAKEHKKIEISKTLVTRKRDTNTDKNAKEEAQARQDAKVEADARRRLARQIGRAADHIGSEMSDATSVELQGPGGGGVPYSNWRQAIKSLYANAWLLPDGADDEAITAASVTIARDGTVLSARITQRSGDPVVDNSVQAALDRVRAAPPLPENAKEDQRTITINFSVKAKRLLG